MDSREYGEKLRDPRWQKRRLEIFQRDDWTCQLCCRADLELHVHHMYRTSEDPWNEPDLHLLTVCKLCHEEQPANPHGSFNNPKRLYVTDDEWWKQDSKEYSKPLQEALSPQNITGLSARDVMKKYKVIQDAIHILRLDWIECGPPALVLCPRKPKRTSAALTYAELMAQTAALRKGYSTVSEAQVDELAAAFESSGAEGLSEILGQRRNQKSLSSD
jgi:hypothetical protein